MRKSENDWNPGIYVLIWDCWDRFPMNTNMTGIRWFSKMLVSLYFGRKKPQHWKHYPATLFFFLKSQTFFLLLKPDLVWAHCVLLYGLSCTYFYCSFFLLHMIDYLLFLDVSYFYDLCIVYEYTYILGLSRFVSGVHTWTDHFDCKLWKRVISE